MTTQSEILCVYLKIGLSKDRQLRRSVYMTFGKRQEKVKFRKRKRIAYAILKLSRDTPDNAAGTLM